MRRVSRVEANAGEGNASREHSSGRAEAQRCKWGDGETEKKGVRNVLEGPSRRMS